jgi:hypothetical protein
MRLLPSLLTATFVVSGAAVLAVAGPASASCPQGFTDINPDTRGSFIAAGANIRTGPGTNCTSRGQGQPGQSATYNCWTVGHDSRTWTHLRNNATGVSGWVRDDLLANNGAPANDRCGVP